MLDLALKSCPFCGSDVTLSVGDNMSLFVCEKYSTCAGTGMFSGFLNSDKDKAIQMWNMRTPPKNTIQWTGDNLFDVVTLCSGDKPDVKGTYAGMMWEEYCTIIKRRGLMVLTLAGFVQVEIGWWITVYPNGTISVHDGEHT